MSSPLKARFSKEADLCSAFIDALPAGWTAYPETAGYDIVLVRDDGVQVGIEAKLMLNAKVLVQAVDGLYSRWDSGVDGPDFRAVLIPYGHKVSEMQTLAGHLGLTIVEQHDAATAHENRYHLDLPVDADSFPFSPKLPDARRDNGELDGWRDLMPAERCRLPEYVPDVVAGASAPSTLSDWKIGAIRICILLERRGSVTIGDFKALRINRQRWLDCRWIKPTDARGVYTVGLRPLDLRAQHPVNYAQIEADYAKWAPPEQLIPTVQLGFETLISAPNGQAAP